MEREINGAKLFNFRDDFEGNPRNPLVRQKYNQILKEQGIEVTLVGLDVLCSLTNLVKLARTLDTIFEDMITLTLSQEEDQQITDLDNRELMLKRKLVTHLYHLEMQELIEVGSIKNGEKTLETYSITDKGREVLQKAKRVFNPIRF